MAFMYNGYGALYIAMSVENVGLTRLPGTPVQLWCFKTIIMICENNSYGV
jgi:hypothetical protein